MILINYYRDNPHCHQWAAQFATPAHLLSAEEWSILFRDAGFADIAHRRIPDPTPRPESYTGRCSATRRNFERFVKRARCLSME